MKTKTFWLACAVLFFSVIGYAQAQVPTNVPITLRATICDTKEQIDSVLSAYQKGGFPAALEVMTTLQKQRNQLGEPVCESGEWKMVVQGRVAVYQNLFFPNAPPVTFYILEVVVDGETYYALSDRDIGLGA